MDKSGRRSWRLCVFVCICAYFCICIHKSLCVPTEGCRATMKKKDISDSAVVFGNERVRLGRGITGIRGKEHNRARQAGSGRNGNKCSHVGAYLNMETSPCATSGSPSYVVSSPDERCSGGVVAVSNHGGHNWFVPAVAALFAVASCEGEDNGRLCPKPAADAGRGEANLPAGQKDASGPASRPKNRGICSISRVGWASILAVAVVTSCCSSSRNWGCW